MTTAYDLQNSIVMKTIPLTPVGCEIIESLDLEKQFAYWKQYSEHKAIKETLKRIAEELEVNELYDDAELVKHFEYLP